MNRMFEDPEEVDPVFDEFAVPPVLSEEHEMLFRAIAVEVPVKRSRKGGCRFPPNSMRQQSFKRKTDRKP